MVCPKAFGDDLNYRAVFKTINADMIWTPAKSRTGDHTRASECCVQKIWNIFRKIFHIQKKAEQRSQRKRTPAQHTSADLRRLNSIAPMRHEIMAHQNSFVLSKQNPSEFSHPLGWTVLTLKTAQWVFQSFDHVIS